MEVRFIEVNGRAGVGVVALSENEYRTAQHLRDYWLYAAFNCGIKSELHLIQYPAWLGRKPGDDGRTLPGRCKRNLAGREGLRSENPEIETGGAKLR
jgi:hypothetical protein